MQKSMKTSFGDISYLDTGSNARSIVFIHGNSACKEVFEYQFDSPLLNSYRLIALDLPGHGASSDAADLDAVYGMSNFATMLKDFCESLQLDKPILVGWSLGGHIAIEACAQGLEASAMLIIGTPPFGPGLEDVEAAFMPSDVMALTGQSSFNEQEAQDYAVAIMGGDQFVSEHLRQQVRRCDGRAREHTLIGWTDVHAGFSAKEFIGQWPHSIAVLHGETEPFVSLPYLRSLTWRNLWRNEIQVMPKTGHAGFFQAPDLFNQLLLDFIEESA